MTPVKIIARWTLLDEKRDEALAALKILAQEVRDKEPFVLTYTIHVPNMTLTSFPTPQPNEVIFISIFDSYENFQEHLHGPVFNDWVAKYKNLFLLNNGNLFVISEWIEQIAGYTR